MTLTTEFAPTASAIGVPNIAKRIEAPEPLTQLALEAGPIPGKKVGGIWTAEEPALEAAHADVARDAARHPRPLLGGPRGYPSQSSLV